MIKVKKFDKEAIIPTRAHSSDGGYDMYLLEDLTIKPLETVCVGFGVGFDIPLSYAGIFVPRSSMAKKGIVIGPAIVDAGYKGEVHLIATNCSKKKLKFQKGDRLCSLCIFKIITPKLEEVNDLGKSDRGSKGLGSTGK